MTVVVVTGEIGAGKSTVTELFRTYGADVISADVIVSQLYENDSQVIAEIAEHFGVQCVVDGTVDRKRLAKEVFSNALSRATLESIVHPRVSHLLEERIAESVSKVVVYDVPIIRARPDYASVVVNVTAPVDVRERRLVARGFDVADARARIAVQEADEFRLREFDYVIANSDDLNALETQVRAIWREISQ